MHLLAAKLKSMPTGNSSPTLRHCATIALLLLLAHGFSPLRAADDPQTLLVNSDQARGGGLPGAIWTVRAQSRENGRNLEPQVLEVRAIPTASVAETLEPARFRGSKLLQVGRNLWIAKPGLSKPIPVSPRQRMTGQASNGDIAATNYAGDYTATAANTEDVNGEPCQVLDLRARHNQTTYDRIRYWISKSRKVATKAEFYSLSGKLIKTATFDYGQQIDYGGRRIPFISRMVIRDALQDGETVLSYDKVMIREVPASEFDLGQL